MTVQLDESQLALAKKLAFVKDKAFPHVDDTREDDDVTGDLFEFETISSKPAG